MNRMLLFYIFLAYQSISAQTYYDLGYNEQKYFKYYQQGKLDNHLSKFTNETGIELANEHFEEKGPTLVKTRNKK